MTLCAETGFSLNQKILQDSEVTLKTQLFLSFETESNRFRASVF